MLMGSDSYELSRCLASLRIAVAISIMISPELHQAVDLAAHPAELRFVPEGAAWLTELGLSPSAVSALRTLVLASGAAALLGYYSRVSMLVLTLAGLPVYALSQRTGSVLHDMHLFWFSALLSVSRSGDVWALDARGGRLLGTAMTYALPVAFARTLLGVVYFFPGYHKLVESGFGWASAEHVIQQMHAQWFQFHELPPLRVDGVPWLSALGGAFVLAFELSFVFLVWWRRTAWIAALSGLLFHALTQVFLFIPFASLWGCYGVLLPWRSILRKKAVDVPRRIRERRIERWMPTGLRRATVAVGAPLLVAASIQGVRGHTQAWPIGCYPTFALPPGDTLPDVLVEAMVPDRAPLWFNGREFGPRSRAEWGTVFRLSGAYGEAVDRDSLKAYALRLAKARGVRVEPGLTLLVFRADYATDPARWDDPPKRLTELAQFPLAR